MNFCIDQGGLIERETIRVVCGENGRGGLYEHMGLSSESSYGCSMGRRHHQTAAFSPPDLPQRSHRKQNVSFKRQASLKASQLRSWPYCCAV